MFNIKGLLVKINSLRAKGVIERESIRGIIKKHIGLDIYVNDIELKSGVIRFKNISQSAKSAIFIKKQNILADINTNRTVLSNDREINASLSLVKDIIV